MSAAPEQLQLDPHIEHVREQLARSLRALGARRVHVVVDRVDAKDGITAHGFVDGGRFGAINRADLQAVVEAAVEQLPHLNQAPSAATQGQ